MRLTKRQLRRVIREEFSRLKRRELIREMRGGSIRAPMDLGDHYVARADPDYAQDAIDVAKQVGIPSPMVVGQVGGAGSNYVIVTDGMGQYYLPLTFSEEEEHSMQELIEALDDAARQDYY